MEDLEDMPSATNYNHGDILAYLINEVYRPRIEEDVDFCLLLSFMPFMNNIMPKIYSFKRTGNKKEAAIAFFAYLKEVDEEGKYQSFVEALRRSKYPFWVKVLENKEVIVSNEDEHKQLINIFFNDIVSTIDPELLSNELQTKDVITLEEGEQIRATARISKRDANLELLLAIPHRSINWYEIFMNILLNYGHINLVKKIDTQFYTKKMGSLEEEPASIIENKDLSLSAPVDILPSGQINSANTTASNVIAAETSSDVIAPTYNAHSQHSTATETLEIEVSSASAVVPANPVSRPDQREGTAASFNEYMPELQRQFAAFQAMFLEQTNYLKTLLQQNEHVIRRVDRLEKKMDDIIRLTSESHRK